MIFTSLSPNAERDDVALTAWSLVRPWMWVRGEWRAKLEAAISTRMGGSSVIAFTSGRGALAAILDAFDIEPGSEILLQAYTCVVVPNAIHWTGFQPVFVDVDEESFNMSAEDLERKITPKSRAVIIQHTFGRPADMDRILETARRHGLIVIEDCAHALGATCNGKPVGTFGDASFFSFGRDKVISCVFGGGAVAREIEIGAKIRAIQERAGDAGRVWIERQLVHPIILALVKATYTLAIGRVIFTLAKKLRIITLAIHPAERTGQRPLVMSKRLPNALALLALHQLEKMDRMNAHRREIAAVYARELAGIDSITFPIVDRSSGVCIRYTILSAKAEQIIAEAKRNNVLLGDWYRTAIAPPGTSKIAGYVDGSCPVAERLAAETVNLPTDVHVTAEDAVRVAGIVRRTLDAAKPV